MAATVTSTATSHEDVKLRVKVVQIDTRYVETDPLNFKSVVQRLTGKDCCVSWIEESSFSCRKTETTSKNVAGKVAAEGSTYGTATVGGGGSGGGVDHISRLSKSLCFKDLERLISEAPPLDELNWLWAEK